MRLMLNLIFSRVFGICLIALVLLFNTIVLFDIHVKAATSTPAFPEAEGFGAYSQGGRGGTVYKIINLNDSGSGSFRNCAEATVPRICIFEVAGTIDLASEVTIDDPYITVAGQTAPGEGVEIKGEGINVRTHDVILRYIRIRPGSDVAEPSNSNALKILSPSENVIIDHVSLSWATDQVASIYGGGTLGSVKNVTIQRSVISEGLKCSTHPEGCHSKGLLIGNGSTNVSVIKNLFAHNFDRNPDVQEGKVELINNVIYNYDTYPTNVVNVSGSQLVELDALGNYYVAGPNDSGRYEIQRSTNNFSGLLSLYVLGNIGPHRTSDAQPETDITSIESQYISSLRNANSSAVNILSADNAYSSILANVGANLPSSDTVDARILKNVTYRSGSIIDEPGDVGGYPTIMSGTTPTDTDGDGMPDTWETRFGLNPNNSADGSQDLDNDGYTNLEEYLNNTLPVVISPFSQTDWRGETGQNTFGDITRFQTSANVVTTATGQITLDKEEKLTNGGMESNISGWTMAGDVGGVQPDTVSGLQMWLKADALTGLSNGDGVTTWTDSSSNARNASESDVNKKPTYLTDQINGLPALDFDGSADRMSFPALTSSDLTVFFVSKTDTGTGTYIARNVNPDYIWQTAATQINIRDSASTTRIVTTSTLGTSSFHVHTFQFDGSGITHYKDSVTDGTAAAAGSITLAQLAARGGGGGADFWNGQIAEVIVYNTSLSTTDRQNVEKYLATKYALSTSIANSAARDTAQSYDYSLASAKVSTVTNSRFTQFVNVGDTRTYFLEAYAFTNGSAVTSSDIELYYNGSTVSTTYTSVGSGWYKLSAEVVGANESRSVGVEVKANKTVYVDSIQLNTYYESGTLTSSIFDSGTRTNWGALNYSATTPLDSRVEVKLRTFDNADASDAPSFNSCNSVLSGSDVSASSCVQDGRRYAQYEITLFPSSNPHTPTFDDITLNFSNFTPTLTPSSGSSDSSSSSPSEPSCTLQKPLSTPDLFQINGNSATGVTLFFTPVLGNQDRYFVSYSTNSSAEEHGFEFANNNNGVISVNVGGLQAQTTYYFKVRAGNGCMPGEWSNVMVARSGQRLPTYRWSSLPRIVSTGVVRRVSPASVQQVEIDASKPTSVPAQPTSQPSKEQTTQPQAQQESPSFLQKVTNFIKGLFGK